MLRPLSRAFSRSFLLLTSFFSAPVSYQAVPREDGMPAKPNSRRGCIHSLVCLILGGTAGGLIAAYALHRLFGPFSFEARYNPVETYQDM
jgi:hypothetical protein